MFDSRSEPLLTAFKSLETESERRIQQLHELQMESERRMQQQYDFKLQQLEEEIATMKAANLCLVINYALARISSIMFTTQLKM